MAFIRIHTKAKKKKLTPKQERDLADAKASAKALKEKWATQPTFAGKYAPAPKIKVKAKQGPPALTNPPGRDKQQVPSLSTPGGSAAKQPDKVYTGTAMKGVAQTHKSNAVPVFDSDHILDISRMRR